MAQLQLSTGLLAFVSEVITLVVLITLTFQMCSQAKTLARDSLEDQIYNNTEITAYQTASVIDRRLSIIINSVTLALSRGLQFAGEYDINSHLNANPTYWDAEIDSMSDFPKVGRLSESDITLLSDSMYLIEVTYDSNTPNVNHVSIDGYTWTVHNSTWTDPGSTKKVEEYFNRSSHLTSLMIFSYEQWPSIAGIYIGSDFGKFACPLLQTCANGDYIYGDSHYRTFRKFPGRDSQTTYIDYDGTNYDIPYDPTRRPWYKAATTTTKEYHLDGPYPDATTGKWMITFSKEVKESTTTPQSVIGVDILLTDLIEIVSSLSIGSNGFAILLLYPESSACASGTCECENGVVRFGNSNWEPVDASTQCTANNDCECQPEPYVLAYASTEINQETKLSAADPGLLASDFTLLRANNDKGSFSYSSGGTAYVGGFGKALDGTMVVVTVAPENEALEPVTSLEDDISKTESSITAIVLIFTLASLCCSMVFVFKSSQQISQPLVDISTNCEIIMDAQTKENKLFNPQPITVFGFDSLFELATEFVKLMKGMHATETKKQAEPKYPTNDFWVGLPNVNAPWQMHPLSRYNYRSDQTEA